MELMVYGQNGTTVRMRGARGSEELCLTDMWKANGSDLSRRPNTWRDLEETSRFLREFAEAFPGCFGFSAEKGGASGGGGTWAHWQIAFRYAAYLSPAFAIWVNKAAREKMEAGLVRASEQLAYYDARFESLLRRAEEHRRELTTGTITAAKLDELRREKETVAILTVQIGRYASIRSARTAIQNAIRDIANHPHPLKFLPVDRIARVFGMLDKMRRDAEKQLRARQASEEARREVEALERQRKLPFDGSH